jgi:riboflavin kinase/FMN adenylyltransferase
MELIRGLHNLRPRHRGCVATIGNYDGVHLGHQAVLRALAGQAARRRQPALVMTFEPTSREYFRPQSAPPRISSLRERLEDLAASGVERVLCVRFDARLAALEPDAFIREILVGKLGLGYLAVGDNFRFGRQRAGDFALLEQAGGQMGFDVECLPALEVDGMRVSSTRIRDALGAGDVEAAATLLGRPYRISGRVSAGQKLGRKLGMPTANLPVSHARALGNGIYVASVEGVAPASHPAVVSLGTRPTLGLTERMLEAHLLDYSGDLYGRRIQVSLLKRLRPELRFSGLEELQQRMHQDLGEARRYFAARA